MPQVERRGLPHTAYDPIEGEEYIPYIPTEERIPEFTATSIIMGTILAIVFGMAMTYLGLKVGMTVSASIPAAVISMGILKGIFKRGTILENNVAQTIASAGEALAGGLIFTIPAIFLWDFKPDLIQILVISVLGATTGVLFMIPLRRYLIVQEHGKLRYPEGTACAEVLVAGDVGGAPARLVFTGIGVAGLYRFLMSAMKGWTEYPAWKIPGLPNAMLSFDVLPALLGVGFIIGVEVSAYMLAGGLLGWFVIIPLISFLGGTLPTLVPPGSKLIGEMSAHELWSSYVRYIGAGAVACGGMISLSKAMPTIISSFKLGFEEILHAFSGKVRKVVRIYDDIPMAVVIIGALVMLVIIALVPHNPAGWLGAILAVIFGFFFATVSSRIVGIVGSSSNPVSGMTIGTLIAVCLVLKAFGFQGTNGMVAAIIVGALVCICICLAGDTSQDLKTGFLVGATPKYLEYGLLIGSVASALFVGWTIAQLNSTYTIGSPELPAPQAVLMSLVVEGIFKANLPWALIFMGAVVSVIVELLGAPALPVAVGLYLPLELSTPIIIGGLISMGIHRLHKDKVLKARIEKGVLIASGLIAGDALMGIIVAVLDSRKINLPGMLGHPEGWALGQHPVVSMLIFAGLAGFLWFYIQAGRDKDLVPPARGAEELEDEYRM